MRHKLPYARSGQVIGLLGGSFDPAHGGHVHITQAALKRFGLDNVWWLVSPGNPLKAQGPAPLPRRLDHARRVMQHPRVHVSDIEAHIGTRYTAQTLDTLRKLYPGVTFVWLMGADNLAQFDRWQDWRKIMSTTPIGIIARPGDRVAARTSKAAKIFAHARLSARASQQLGRSKAGQAGKTRRAGKTRPQWCFINVPMNGASSTDIRNAGDWT